MLNECLFECLDGWQKIVFGLLVFSAGDWESDGMVMPIAAFAIAAHLVFIERLRQVGNMKRSSLGCPLPRSKSSVGLVHDCDPRLTKAEYADSHPKCFAFTIHEALVRGQASLLN